MNWDLAQAAELLADARRAAPDVMSPLPAVAATAFLYLNGDGDVDGRERTGGYAQLSRHGVD